MELHTMNSFFLFIIIIVIFHLNLKKNEHLHLKKRTGKRQTRVDYCYRR